MVPQSYGAVIDTRYAARSRPSESQGPRRDTRRPGYDCQGIVLVALAHLTCQASLSSQRVQCVEIADRGSGFSKFSIGRTPL
jgi:hypothetical protein